MRENESQYLDVIPFGKEREDVGAADVFSHSVIQAFNHPLFNR
jgi:hypothetical protein